MVLITGQRDRAERLRALFEAHDVRGIVSTKPTEPLPDAAQEGLDYYVQLPVTVAGEGDTAVSRVGSFLTNGLLARFTSVQNVLPLLNTSATVVLVAGNLPAELTAPDDRHARLALLRVLAHCARADLASRGDSARVVVVGAERSDEQILQHALTGRADPEARLAPPQPAPTNLDVARAYVDWRTEIIGLVGVDG
jgi:hypothetical protein